MKVVSANKNFFVCSSARVRNNHHSVWHFSVSSRDDLGECHTQTQIGSLTIWTETLHFYLDTFSVEDN